MAVKRLRPSILKNKEELFSFIEECKLLRKLSHRCYQLTLSMWPSVNGLPCGMHACMPRSHAAAPATPFPEVIIEAYVRQHA